MKTWDVVWAAWFAAFVVLELLAVAGVVPWQTLSSTVWAIERLSAWAKIVILAGLCVLTAHIVWGFPDRLAP